MKKSEKYFCLMAIVFCACLIASNIFEIKIFHAGPLTLTGGFLIFPISYIINDCLTEVYGYRKARFVIWTAFALNLCFVLLAQLVRILPSESFWDGQQHFDYIFKADLRITVASMAAFVFGSLVNARVMSDMKAADGERRFCLRAVVSSLAGEGIDSVIFFPIAFWAVGMRNLLLMMVTQIILKTAYEVVVLPLTRLFVRRIRSELAAENR